MNVTLYFVLRAILRVVVQNRTHHGKSTFFRPLKNVMYSKGNQKCLFGDDSGDFAVPGNRNRTDVLSDDEIDKFRKIS